MLTRKNVFDTDIKWISLKLLSQQANKATIKHFIQLVK